MKAKTLSSSLENTKPSSYVPGGQKPLQKMSRTLPPLRSNQWPLEHAMSVMGLCALYNLPQGHLAFSKGTQGTYHA